MCYKIFSFIFKIVSCHFIQAFRQDVHVTIVAVTIEVSTPVLEDVVAL